MQQTHRSGFNSPVTDAHKRKWLKIVLITLGAIIIILTAGWFILTAYIQNHKKEILSDITEKISDNISGKLTIRDMEPALLKSFPDISVRLDSVTLSDSLYAQHHLKTVALQSVFVRLNLLSLLSNRPQIKKITLSQGVIQLFTLKDGYSNNYLLKGKKKKTSKNSSKQLNLHLFGLENITFIARHDPHHKLFKISCNQVNLSIKNTGEKMDIKADLDLFVHQLGFNLRKGNYLEGRELSGKIAADFNRKDKTLHLENQHLDVNGTLLKITALFNFGHHPAFFRLNLEAPSLNYAKGIAMLPRNISEKLGKITAQKPISVQASINGGFDYPDTPLVKVRVEVKNNRVATAYGSFDQAYFTAFFNNHLEEGKGKGDDNSGVFIPELKGDWMGMPVAADSVSLNNLIHPQLKATVKGDFPTSRLNKILGHSFAITKGNTAFKLIYNGPLSAKDTFARSLNGYILLKNTDLTYLPRALKFTNCNAALVFQGTDLFIKTMSLGMGKSAIQIKGRGEDFLNAYFSGNEKAVFDCQLESQKIDLNDFKPLLAPRKQYKVSAQAKNKKISSFNKNLDELLNKSTMILHLKIKKIDYDRFTAKKLSAGLRLDEQGIGLNKVSLQHANGTVNFDAHIQQLPKRNDFSLKADLSQLKIDQLFNAFKNFGQSTLKSENLKGILSANIDVKGSLTQEATLVPKSLAGKVSFNLNNGELNNFPPFLSISKFVFKNRNLDHITFEALSDELTLSKGKIEIPPMDILSSAISITVQGVYAFGRGTDISLKIPLRNPQKDKERMAQGLKPKRNKGIVVYLRAQDGKDGKVHIGWDPLQKQRMADTAETNDDLPLIK